MPAFAQHARRRRRAASESLKPMLCVSNGGGQDWITEGCVTLVDAATAPLSVKAVMPTFISKGDEKAYSEHNQGNAHKRVWSSLPS